MKADQSPKNFFTTHQIATLVGVDPKTVRTWIDAKKLRGFHIPGSKHRRVTRADLVTFIRDHGLPMPSSLSSAGPSVEPAATSA